LPLLKFQPSYKQLLFRKGFEIGFIGGRYDYKFPVALTFRNI